MSHIVLLGDSIFDNASYVPEGLPVIDHLRFQNQIASCTLCKKEFPRIKVDCPPGLLYPRPPQPVKILFVGVAPPQKGRHFYTDPNDKLRRGLFAVLKCFGWPCKDLNDFHRYAFFLVHTAKCATTKPSLSVSYLCSSLYLKREIELLLPDGVCWLSKNVGYPVARKLSQQWSVQGGDLPFGQVTPVIIKGKQVQFLTTTWPGRGHETLTKSQLEKLFKALGFKPP